MSGLSEVPVVEGLVVVGDSFSITASECSSCGALYVPVSRRCRNPECTGERLAVRPLSSTGELISWTRQVYPPPPPFRMDDWDGLLIGLVEVEQRLQLIGILHEVEEEQLRYRMPVRVVPRTLYVDDAGHAVVTYAYAPVEVTA